VISADGATEDAVAQPEEVAPAARVDQHRRHPRDNETTALFRLMGKNAIWSQVASVEMQGWTTFHTQGLVKIGDIFYVSSVEVLEPTVRNGNETDALYDFSTDRSAGRGRGWLSRFTADGHLLGQVELTSGTMYHPGGIDYDGRHIWVPVSEYRPNSQSNIYRVDPETLRAELVFHADDHIGGIVHNVHRGTMHGVSWGSRRLYTWQVAGRERDPFDRGAVRAVESRWTPNVEAHIDYQDCHYQGVEFMLCGGVGSYTSPVTSFAFGGLDLVDLRDARPAHQIPVNGFVDEGNGPNPLLSLTHNAFWAEPLGNRSLRFYFMTESDNQAALLSYDATPWVNR
jgi:hypothetical protein